MAWKGYVRPGKTASVLAIIVCLIMLILGVVFFMAVREDGSEIGQIFIPLWMLVILVIMGYYVYNLAAKKKSSAAMSQFELEMQGGKGSAEERLRSLERMKKERLITEEEYRKKRQEILDEKW